LNFFFSFCLLHNIQNQDPIKNTSNMLSLKQVISQKKTIPKIKELLSACEGYEFDSSNDDGPIHGMMHQLRNLDFSKKMKKKLVYTLMDIDYLKIVPHIIDRNQEALERGIQNVDLSYFEGNNKEMFEDSLVNYLTENIGKRKIIFFNLSLRNYCYDNEEEDRYATHGSCAFMVPRKGTGYDMYYINHHGEAMNTTLIYERVLTRTRNQKYSFKHPVDFIVLDQIVKYMNTKLKETIYYDFTTLHNFYGINYQEEDIHGFCFIFPIIIYYSLGKFFDENKQLNVGGVFKNLNPISQTLKEGKLNFFIHSCFTEFEPSYNEVVFNYLGTEKEEKKFMEELDAVLAKLKFRFLKKLTGYMYQYLTQQAMLTKLNLPKLN
jgi:hypothetical protein